MKDKTNKTAGDPSNAAISMIKVLVTSLEGVIVKKEKNQSSILILWKKTTDWMPKMTVPTCIVSIVVSRVTAKSTVGSRR